MHSCAQDDWVVFRADASTSIGAGHVMRCITLASQLRAQDIESCFICREHPGHMAAKIESAGFRVHLLPRAREIGSQSIDTQLDGIDRWLGASVAEDARQTLECLALLRPRWLIVDHFSIDIAWEQAVRQQFDVKIMLIDGLANRKHDCDLLLDQTFSPQAESRWHGLIPESCELFVGPKYALLRSEFVEASKNLRRRSGAIRRIFVAFGGTDEPNATGRVIDALRSLALENVAIDVVIGPGNPNRADILRDCRGTTNLSVHVDPANVAELMALADLAIGGGGTMTWERCLLRLPCLMISIADNQVSLARALESISAVVYLGDLGSVSEEIIKNRVKKLMSDEQEFIKMADSLETLMPQSDSSVTDFLVTDIK